MSWYRNLTIGKKILAGFLIVGFVAGLSGVFSTGVIRDVTGRGALMYTTNLLPISDLGDAVDGFRASRYLLRDIVIDRSPQERNAHLEQLKQADDRVTKGLAAFIRSNRSSEAAALHGRISADLALYHGFRRQVVELAASGRRDEAIDVMRQAASGVIDRIDGNIARIVAINKAQALERYRENSSSARTALYMNLLCLLFGVASALGMGWFIADGITRPLRLLTETVGSIAAGDLTSVTAGPYPPDSRNELHILSRNFDRMTGTLHALITRIDADSQLLSSSSGRLDRTSESMARWAEAASTRIGAVSASSGEMNHISSEIARNCSTAAANLSFANQGVAESRRIMDETIHAMRRIGEHVRETEEVIATLGERSIQIGEITSTIDDIADQTNLLALNAAIEAARAGEHGRGFAVVADEVRALAARTTGATREISAMIQAIQAETKRAISSMGNGVNEVEEGTTMVARTGEALMAIAGTIGTISSEVDQIAIAAEVQSASVYEMTIGIDEVTTIIRENAGGTQEFAAAASDLNRMAGDLQEIVGGFKLGRRCMEKGAPADEPCREGYLFPTLAAVEG